MTISELIENLNSKVTAEFKVDISYSHPTLYIFCLSERFRGLSEDVRMAAFREVVSLSESDIQSVISNTMVEFHLVTENERNDYYGYLSSDSEMSSWLGAFNPSLKHTSLITAKDNTNQVRAIHFYGYKGGQGRSTVLLALAKTLANSGHRVLLVDADLEAPSLDAMLEVSSSDVESTVMGLTESSLSITPLSKVYVGTASAGHIDLISSRPSSARFDMDFAAFLLNSSLDVSLLKYAFSRLRRHVEQNSLYDVILFDHRTGLAPSVLPIMEAWPGSAVIFVRTDGMARHIQESKLIDILLSHDKEYPGAFVTFSLDPKKQPNEIRNENARFIDSLLDKIGDSMCIDGESPADIQELDPYWIFWRHDQSFVDGLQPNPKDMSAVNRYALEQLRTILGVSGSINTPRQEITLTSSGSSDEGQFIQTPWLAKLFTKDSPYSYIFGRKGTGKTRLLTELVKGQLAEPLLVANDSLIGGIQSAGIIFTRLLQACSNDFEMFFWSLLNAALQVESTVDAASLEDSVNDVIRSIHQSSQEVHKNIVEKASHRRRIFVIDGIETAVPAADLRGFVEALFRFLATVQYDRNISKNITIRLLLRTDLATGASQNVEQQIEGAVMYLHWNKTAILNFALARIVSLPWFYKTFNDVCSRIEDRADVISRGALPDEEAESLLLEIFPESLERNRLKTTTFFSLYFSDAGGDFSGDSAFYPRLFDSFLRILESNCLDSDSIHIKDGRISSMFVLKAYDQASRDFIDDVRTELYSFLNLTNERGQNNKELVNRFVESFNGLTTPFVVEDIIPVISDKINIEPNLVRQSLTSMLRIGIFESRPGYPGELRARQLYKAGLGMKYVRKPQKK
ncbi:AAA family ATPase [Aeromonas caviae]|uniref:AAA family ATPase n=1 Tax=Aeromonas caviae TaxID=648 RepID=UPI002B4777EB|nr:AAA family ATPase [Aeromonas caviae]